VEPEVQLQQEFSEEMDSIMSSIWSEELEVGMILITPPLVDNQNINKSIISRAIIRNLSISKQIINQRLFNPQRSTLSPI